MAEQDVTDIPFFCEILSGVLKCITVQHVAAYEVRISKINYSECWL